MPLLIDGYNVLWHPMPVSLAGLNESGLAQLLSRGRFAGQSATIVFDGQPKNMDGVEASALRARVIFSGPSQSADDVIMQRIAADSAPRRLVVVSDDREIQKAARRRRCSVWPSAWLIQALARESERSGQSSGAGQQGGPAGSPGSATPSASDAARARSALSDADLAALTESAEAERRRLEAMEPQPGALSRDEVERWLEEFGLGEDGQER